MPVVGDIVEDTPGLIMARKIAQKHGHDIYPAHWQICPNCGRLFPHEDNDWVMICAPCGLGWAIALIKEGRHTDWIACPEVDNPKYSLMRREPL